MDSIISRLLICRVSVQLGASASVISSAALIIIIKTVTIGKLGRSSADHLPVSAK